MRSVLLTIAATVVLLGASVGINASEPTDDLDGEWTGFIGCTVSMSVFVNFNCPGSFDENVDQEHTFEVEPELRTIVVAMDWEPTLSSTTDRLRHWLYIDDQSKVRFNNATAPLEYRVDHSDDPQGQFEHDFDQFTEPVDFMFRVTGPTAPFVHLVYQQPFTVYFHLFYGEHAPDGYSALPG